MDASELPKQIYQISLKLQVTFSTSQITVRPWVFPSY